MDKSKESGSKSNSQTNNEDNDDDEKALGFDEIPQDWKNLKWKVRADAIDQLNVLAVSFGFLKLKILDTRTNDYCVLGCHFGTKYKPKKDKKLQRTSTI